MLADGSPVIVGSSDSLNFPKTQDALDENECSSAAVFCSVDAFAAVFASDALAALNAALGATQCLLCICDLNGDGNVSATDALLDAASRRDDE